MPDAGTVQVGGSSSSSYLIYDDDNATFHNDVLPEERITLDKAPEGEYKEYEAYRLSKTGKILKVKLHGKELTKEELVKFKDQVEAGKLKEIWSWVSHGAISIIHQDDALTRPMTARWVVQWKEMPDGTYVIKCRLVVRGFQDPQGYGRETYSPTGSRLSQRHLIRIEIRYTVIRLIRVRVRAARRLVSGVQRDLLILFIYPGRHALGEAGQHLFPSGIPYPHRPVFPSRQ